MTRKEAAQVHHKSVLEQDTTGDIAWTVERSIIYTGEFPSLAHIADTDCLSAAIEAYESGMDSCEITILNFASFHQPGGGYMNGAMAQEESLCSESNLWEILNDNRFRSYYKSNHRIDDNGLYADRAIYSPEVKFTRDGKDYFFNVLTCAAPNYNRAIGYYDEEEIIEAYENRLRYIYRVLLSQSQYILIAGAWGCGVFGFPREVAFKLFEECATIPTVLAVPSSTKFQNKRSNE